MRYFLKIEDCDEKGNPVDKALPVIADGKYDGGVLSLNYVFDGAEYSLKVSANSVYHDRYGDIRMSLEFRLGELTCGSLESSGMNGDFDIFTHELDISLTSEGCSVHLVFSDGASGGDKIVKNITAYQVK